MYSIIFNIAVALNIRQPFKFDPFYTMTANDLSATPNSQIVKMRFARVSNPKLPAENVGGWGGGGCGIPAAVQIKGSLRKAAAVA